MSRPTLNRLLASVAVALYVGVGVMLHLSPARADFGPAQGAASAGLSGPGSSTSGTIPVWDGTGGDALTTSTLSSPAAGTLLAPTALVVGAATTSGVRLEVDANGNLEAREGDDSAGVGVVVKDGTGAAPGIGFASTTNTGFLRSGASNIGVALSGTERFNLYNVSATRTAINLSNTTAEIAHSGGMILRSSGGGTQVEVLRNAVTRKVYGGSVALTDNVATTVCTIALASGERVGGTVTYSIDVTDGTDHQVRSGSFDFAAVDKAGALTSQITENDTQAIAVSAGTLTDAWTVSDGSNAISLQLTADSSLTPTGMTVRFEVSLFGAAATVTIP